MLLSELTPKQVRNNVEEQLGLKQGTLDDYKKKLKAVMESTVVGAPAFGCAVHMYNLCPLPGRGAGREGKG
jgi:hypothetical protein